MCNFFTGMFSVNSNILFDLKVSTLFIIGEYYLNFKRSNIHQATISEGEKYLKEVHHSNFAILYTGQK